MHVDVIAAGQESRPKAAPEDQEVHAGTPCGNQHHEKLAFALLILLALLGNGHLWIMSNRIGIDTRLCCAGMGQGHRGTRVVLERGVCQKPIQGHMQFSVATICHGCSRRQQRWRLPSMERRNF